MKRAPFEPLDAGLYRELVRRALAEDFGWGDVTTEGVIRRGQKGKAVLLAKSPCVIAGLDLFCESFRQLDPGMAVTLHRKDGEWCDAGTEVAALHGDAAALLTAERTALNIVQHLSGISTLTRRYAELVQGTGATLIDTRKTIPTLRNLAKYASYVGGARNHRIRLDDGVLIKDNHIAVCGGLTAAIQRAKRQTPALTVVEVECDTLDQVREAVAAGAGMILLDNMGVAELKEAVKIAQGRAVLEASGGITLETIREKASSGVNFVSVGRMTQSAPAVDIGLDYGA